MVFNKGNQDEIKRTMDAYLQKRLETQPYDKPNAGSTFKRGDGFITAMLIDEAGLKGHTIGGAQVSEKHAGFIVNTGNATAKDILDLIKYVQKTIMEKYGKAIEPEVRILG
jgi:UDP-N-acetylmuramate dehydrogenase